MGVEILVAPGFVIGLVGLLRLVSCGCGRGMGDDLVLVQLQHLRRLILIGGIDHQPLVGFLFETPARTPA